MTEKRFRLDTGCFIDMQENKVLTDRQVNNLLNEQHKTIERLNQQLRIFSDGLKAEIRETKEVFEDYSECVDEKKQLKQENEQLKSEIEKLSYANEDLLEQKRSWEECSDNYAELYHENEQLKHRLAISEKGNFVTALEKENEQLKQQIHYLKVVCRNELDDERLKQVMGSLGDVE